ncbi:MAG TPA: TolC family protein [Nitrospirales bacterium]|nr:TolC family protein [Nitrospirales bacterium]
MRQRLFAFIVVGLWMLTYQIAAAQPSATEPPVRNGFLGLRQAVEIGIANHPVLQEGSANVKAAEARTEQTRSLYYPQVFGSVDTASGAGRINPRFLIGGGLLQPNLSAYSAGVIANQRIYDFGFTKNLVESNKIAERATAEDLEARRAIVTVTVQRAYLTSLKRKRLVQIAEETVRERGVIKNQIAALHRQQLKSKLDLDLVQVELTNAESLLVKARNDLKASYADLNRAMGVAGAEDYILEEVSTGVRGQGTLEGLINDSRAHPELRRAREFTSSAAARYRAMKKQYLPVVSAMASGGNYDTFDSSRNVPTGGWWTAGAMLSVPLFTGFAIENQVREAAAQQNAAEAGAANIEQALTQQVTTSYLETITLAEQIKLAEEQVRTAQEALQLAKQRYKLGLGSVVEVTQSEVALTMAQTRLADVQYDYKIAEVTLAYATARTSRTLTESGTP